MAAISFATEMILMSGVNMFAMAVVMKVVLGWDISFSIFVSSIAVAIYVGLGGLRSAIFNEVLQFVLIWGGALLVPILGLVQTGGVDGLKRQIMANMQSVTGVHSDSYFHLWRDTGSFAANPMGVHWTGIVFGLGFVISFGYWTTDFLVVQRVLAAHNLRAARMAPIIGFILQNGRALHRHPARPARPGAAAESRWQPPPACRRGCRCRLRRLLNRRRLETHPHALPPWPRPRCPPPINRRCSRARPMQNCTAITRRCR